MTKEFGFTLVVLLAIVVGLMWLLTWLTNSPVSEIERGVIIGLLVYLTADKISDGGDGE